MDSLTLAQLESDKKEAQAQLVQIQEQFALNQVNINRLQGILAYIDKHLAAMKEGDKNAG